MKAEIKDGWNWRYKKAVTAACADLEEMQAPTPAWPDQAAVIITKHLTPLFRELRDEAKRAATNRKQSGRRVMPDRLVSRDAMRAAVAAYMRSEGCSCCRNCDAHTENKAALGRLLKVPKHKDGSGYDFARFEAANEKGQP